MTSTQIDDVRRRISRARNLIEQNGHDLGEARAELDEVLAELREHSRDALTREIRDEGG